MHRSASSLPGDARAHPLRPVEPPDLEPSVATAATTGQRWWRVAAASGGSKRRRIVSLAQLYLTFPLFCSKSRS